MPDCRLSQTTSRDTSTGTVALNAPDQLLTIRSALTAVST